MADLAVTFDLGGVLVDWDPRYLYRELLPDEAAVERFLAGVCTQAWNQRQDAGRPVAEAIAELSARFPGQAELIAAYYGRFAEMIGPVIADNVSLVGELADRGVPLYALTNWSAECFVHLEERADAGFLDHFRGVLVSGHEGIRKPDPRIYHLLCERYGLDPGAVLFIDDVEENCAAARTAGLEAIRYRRGDDLRTAVLEWLRGCP
jgi:2-haloacid dehalogenase